MPEALDPGIEQPGFIVHAELRLRDLREEFVEFVQRGYRSGRNVFGIEARNDTGKRLGAVRGPVNSAPVAPAALDMLPDPRLDANAALMTEARCPLMYCVYL